MSLQIIIKSRLHGPEKHDHLCPWCKKLKHESNEVCGKSLAGMNLPYHRFPCFVCQQDIRTRLGSEVLDGFIGTMAAAASTKAIPLEKVQAREEREVAAGDLGIAEVLDAAKKL